MATVLKYWREAATLILVSARRSGTNVKFNPVSSSNQGVKGDNMDVLMLKRSSKSTFMPNLYVFPGGIASDADFSREWLDVFSAAGEDGKSALFKFVKGHRPGAPMFSRIRDPQFTAIPSELAFRICAIRETFEESGVLLARNMSDLKNAVHYTDSPIYGTAVEELANVDEWRKRVEKNADEFITMCKDLKIVPDVWSLYEWSNWLTPAHEIIAQRRKPRRYDTAFYLCCVDEKPEVAEDKGETVHSQWGTALNILMESESGRAGIASPQLYELSRFLHFNTLEDLNHFAWSRSDERVQRFMPVRFETADNILYLMPGDGLYPEKPDVYGEEEVLSSDLTLEEINQKHPRFHRTMYSVVEGKRTGQIFCNIEMAAKHIPPYVNFPSLIDKSPDSKL